MLHLGAVHCPDAMTGCLGFLRRAVLREILLDIAGLWCVCHVNGWVFVEVPCPVSLQNAEGLDTPG